MKVTRPLSFWESWIIGKRSHACPREKDIAPLQSRHRGQQEIGFIDEPIDFVVERFYFVNRSVEQGLRWAEVVHSAPRCQIDGLVHSIDNRHSVALALGWKTEHHMYAFGAGDPSSWGGLCNGTPIHFINPDARGVKNDLCSYRDFRSRR
jgi:hypothetical protein